MFNYAGITGNGIFSSLKASPLHNVPMLELSQGLAQAYGLVSAFDHSLIAIVGLSFKVSGVAVILAALLALPLGAWLALHRFPGRAAVLAVINGLMGLPPVVVGLLVYLMLSRAGPLGTLGLLFTPSAMMIAQTILVLPIICALTVQVVGDAWEEYREQLHSMRAGSWQCMRALLWDTRFSLVTVVLAGFGRAIAEVGAVMIVGGNIDGLTRLMTTAIALETSKGDLSLALALGLVLIVVVVALNALAQGLKTIAMRRYG
jgi:tungstate transport system permease protein